MTTELIFLHIEKAAGTSIRGLFYENYGKNNVFWHDINTPGEERSFKVVGGHRGIGFYKKDQNTLLRSPVFMAVIREPISRVVSLYAHLERHTDYFRKNPASSFREAILKCEPFRNHIKSGQLSYLTGQADFLKFQSILKDQLYVVGSMDKLDQFTSYIVEKLELAKHELPKSNLGQPGYKDSIEIDDEIFKALGELLQEDIKLYEFIVSECNGFYTNIPDTTWHDKVTSLSSTPSVNKTFEGNSNILNANSIPKSLKPRQAFGLNVSLTNRSTSIWNHTDGDIAWSYHWYDSKGSEVLIFEGVRTPIKGINLAPKRTLNGRMKIITPASEGVYVLKVIPLKTKVSWFDNFNFVPASITIEVTNT